MTLDVSDWIQFEFREYKQIDNRYQKVNHHNVDFICSSSKDKFQQQFRIYCSLYCIYIIYIGYIMEKLMFDQLREFLINEEFPKELDKKQRWTFRRRASNFLIDGRPKVDI